MSGGRLRTSECAFARRRPPVFACEIPARARRGPRGGARPSASSARSRGARPRTARAPGPSQSRAGAPWPRRGARRACPRGAGSARASTCTVECAAVERNRSRSDGSLSSRRCRSRRSPALGRRRSPPRACRCGCGRRPGLTVEPARDGAVGAGAPQKEEAGFRERGGARRPRLRQALPVREAAGAHEPERLVAIAHPERRFPATASERRYWVAWPR